LCELRYSSGIGNGDIKEDGNPYWDAMVAAAFRKRPAVMITRLLIDYTRKQTHLHAGRARRQDEPSGQRVMNNDKVMPRL
jgi:hypothetical protein